LLKKRWKFRRVRMIRKDPQSLINKFESTHPKALRLAEVVSIAIRVEPELLRMARLTLVPEANAGDEADLWFSPLVQIRNMLGFVFYPEIAKILRQRLASHMELLNDVWYEVFRKVHGNISPALFVEEEITWRALTDSNDPEIENLLRRTLAAMLQEQDQNGVSHWVLRALPNLPDSIHQLQITQMLELGARLRFGDADASLSIHESVASAPIPDWISLFVPSSLGRVKIGVRFVDAGIEFGDLDSMEGAEILEVPATNPLWVDVSWVEKSGQKHITQILLKLGDFFLLTVETEEVELKTLSGDQYKLSKIGEQKGIYDVFFSYPHKDSEKVMLILEALRARGLKVWIDTNEIRDFAGITRSIVDGLARSRVIMAFYSLNYAHSRACQWELTAGFLAAQREGDPQQRVLIINPEEMAEHIHPVELRDELFQKAPADPQAIDSLVSSIKTHISIIESTIGEIKALTQPRWFGKKGISSNRFVGRLPNMWHIHSFLHNAEVPIITGAIASATVQIHGTGGVGKSLLAEEYALRYAAAFPGGVFWLRAFGNDDVKTAMGPQEREAECIQQIRDIAEEYGIPVKERSPKEIEAHLAREMGNHDHFLWIVDDIPSGMDVETLERWLAPHPQGKTLITTRTKEYDFLGTLIPLGVLEEDEAWELLISWRKPEGEEEKEAARQIIEDLGCHALALDVAGAALHKSEGLQSFAEFREELANPTQDELELAAEFRGVLPNDHEKSIASTLIRSIERLEPEGWDFLRLASVLAVAPIPASLISSVFSEVDGLDEAKGRRRAVLGLDQAENLSLAERVEDEQGARSVHTLISRTLRFYDSQPERTSQLERAAFQALTGELSQADDPRVHGELRLAVTHARELVNRSDDILAADLMTWLGRFDYVRGAYNSAESLWRRECELRRTHLGAEQPSTLTTMNNLAETLWAQGELEDARKIHEQVLEIRRRVLGAEHPDTLTSMNNLAGTLRDQGELEDARKIQEQVLEITRRVLGAEHPDTLTSMNNLAETLRAQGELEDARKIHEQVLEITRRVLGAEHPDTLTSMNNLALTLGAQGEMKDARKIQEQVLEIMLSVLGTEHPSTLRSMNNLAETLRAQGELEDARKIQEQVLEITRRVLGAEHPYTLTSMNNLALTLQDQGELEGARKIQEQVLEIRRRVLGAEHPDTLTSMNNLAGTLRDQGELEDARKIHEQVLEIRRRVLGAEHPDTLRSMNNLAETLRTQGKLEDARKIQEQVLEITRRVLGAEHPNTLGSMNNLAETLRAQGKLEGARKIQEQVLEIMQRVLGAEHPDTLTSVNNLAETLRAQGELEGARKIQEQVLEIMQRVLGAEHPDTLTSMNNLAATLQAQGELEGAQKIQEQVLEIRRRVLGAEHPNTSTSAWNLLNTMSEMDDVDESKKILENDLVWLLDRDPESLGAYQRQIREMIIRMLQEADQPE
jgi:tetratricopeptide (TPR) repeat protein